MLEYTNMMVWNEDGHESITVNMPDQPTLLADIDRCFHDRAGFSIATLNLDHVVKLSTNASFRAAYAKHSHVTADGNPIVWLSRLAGQEVSLVPGSELIEPLTDLAAQRAIPIAFFGSNEDTLSQAAAVLQARYPGLQVAFQAAPAMGFDPKGKAAAAYIADLQASGARLCFLALGAPKQEIFAQRASAIMPEVGFVSIGAGIDFIAGTQKRAPAWVRKLAAEWLWRMFSNPRRLAARYIGCILAMPGLTWRALRIRRRAAPAS